MEGLPLCLPPSSSTSSRTWWQGIWNNWPFPTIRQSKQKQHGFTFPGKGERLVQGVEITQTRSFLSIISFERVCYHLIFNVRSCSTARTVSRCLTWGWVKIFTGNICFSPWIHLVLFNLTLVLARCSAPTALERPSPTMLDTRSDRLPLLGLSVKISSTFNEKWWWSWWHLKI